MKQMKSDPVGKVIYTLFHGGESLKLQIDEIISGQIINQTVTTFLLSEKNNVSGIDLNPHSIRNEIGECIGFMILARENKGLVNIQERFHLTNRELEVLLLLNDGLSAREISDECEISLLTTKTHIHNIYRKTELRNRVEISNLLNKNT
jgi:DNA-binding CsgD family transcriptional regulator